MNGSPAAACKLPPAAEPWAACWRHAPLTRASTRSDKARRPARRDATRGCSSRHPRAAPNARRGTTVPMTIARLRKGCCTVSRSWRSRDAVPHAAHRATPRAGTRLRSMMFPLLRADAHRIQAVLRSGPHPSGAAGKCAPPTCSRHSRACAPRRGHLRADGRRRQTVQGEVARRLVPTPESEPFPAQSLFRPITGRQWHRVPAITRADRARRVRAAG